MKETHARVFNFAIFVMIFPAIVLNATATITREWFMSGMFQTNYIHFCGKGSFCSTLPLTSRLQMIKTTQVMVTFIIRPENKLFMKL